MKTFFKKAKTPQILGVQEKDCCVLPLLSNGHLVNSWKLLRGHFYSAGARCWIREANVSSSPMELTGCMYTRGEISDIELLIEIFSVVKKCKMLFSIPVQYHLTVPSTVIFSLLPFCLLFFCVSLPFSIFLSSSCSLFFPSLPLFLSPSSLKTLCFNYFCLILSLVLCLIH